MLDNPPTMTREELAKVLGISPATLGNKLKQLYAEGFPKPLPHLSVWSRQLVLDWINWQEEPAEKAA
jgi:predicted DNA-binding transcriptional regulator AlpA